MTPTEAIAAAAVPIIMMLIVAGLAAARGAWRLVDVSIALIWLVLIITVIATIVGGSA